MMSRFRRSKQPADLSVSTPTPPVKVLQNLASQRNSRALAVSSTAIALSIGSPFHDACGTSSDGATIRGSDTAWQVAYGAARMAVEIAKESSDMFLPLKAVVGAMSALIKNYDVSEYCSQSGCLLIDIYFVFSCSSKHQTMCKK